VVDAVRPWLFGDGNYSTPPSTTVALNYEKELSDTISCYVEREINGIYELTMQYPITGVLYSSIAVRAILYVNPDEYTGRQMFRIYKITKPLNGIVTIYARHIAYDLDGIVCEPFTASGIQNALSGIISNSIPSNYFTFSTTRTTASTFTVVHPDNVWSLMAGQAGSLLDVYGGEFDFDNYTISLENRIGADNGVVIEYGKNIKALRQDEDGSNMVKAIYPYYYTEDDGLVDLPEKVLVNVPSLFWNVYKAVDLTDRFQGGAPTENELRTAAQAYLDNNVTWQPKISLDVDFVPLWQTQEYEGDAREVVHLGDTVTIKYTALGVNATARAMAYKYNCLKERYEKITVGSVKADLTDAIRQVIGAYNDEF
jgi:phage minor structural protein